jgi:hypothetical protein
MIRLIPTVRSRQRVGDAAIDAVVDGLALYGPHVVGFALFAILICALATFLHVVLGLSMTAAAVLGSAISLASRAAVLVWRAKAGGGG